MASLTKTTEIDKMLISEYEAQVQELIRRCPFNYSAWLAGITLLNKDFDRARRPVADAAWFLFSVQQSTPNWLRANEPKCIRDRAKLHGEAAFKMGLPVSVGCDLWSIGSGVCAIRLTGTLIGGAVVIDSPKRLETADAAQFLAMDIGIGEYWLKNVGAEHIRVDAEDFRRMVKGRQVEVIVNVHHLADESSGGYIDLKFFKGGVKVGETHITGKTTSPRQVRVTLSGNFDIYRVESTPSAKYSIERVKK